MHLLQTAAPVLFVTPTALNSDKLGTAKLYNGNTHIVLPSRGYSGCYRWSSSWLHMERAGELQHL